MVTTTEQIVREAPEVEARKLGLLDTAKSLAQMPVGGYRYNETGAPIMENVIDPMTGLPMKDEAGNIIQRPVRAGLPEQRIAGLGPQQQRAIGLGETGIGAYEPYLASALQSQAAGLGTLGQAATAYTNIGQAPTMEQIQPFMNPYQQAIQDEINRAYNIAQQGQAAQAIQAGAFGGGREGIAQAELERNRASALAQAQAQAFLNAQQQLGQRQQSSAAGLGALAPQYGAFGAQQAQLGVTGQQLGGQDINTLLGLGGITQQFGFTDPTTGAFTPGQAQLEAQRASQVQNLYEPYQRLGFLSDIYQGAPTSAQTIQTQTAPSTSGSPLAQIAGYGIAGLGALGQYNALSGMGGGLF
jgi:hypothetical protein